MPEPFGAVAKAARLACEVRIRDVAEHLGFTGVYVSDIERGFRPPPQSHIVRAWATYLGADPEAWHRLALREKSEDAAALLDEIDDLQSRVWEPADGLWLVETTRGGYAYRRIAPLDECEPVAVTEINGCRAETYVLNGYWRQRVVPAAPAYTPDSRTDCLVPPVGPRLGAALNGRVGEGRR